MQLVTKLALSSFLIETPQKGVLDQRDTIRRKRSQSAVSVWANNTDESKFPFERQSENLSPQSQQRNRGSEATMVRGSIKMNAIMQVVDSWELIKRKDSDWSENFGELVFEK